MRAVGDFLNAVGHGQDVAADRIGMALLGTGVFFGTLGQPVKLLGHAGQRAGGIDDLPDGALQLVDKAVEQLNHFADFVVGVDIHPAGQVAVTAGDGLQ